MTEEDPLLQDDALTLEAELRQALQHRRAAQQQADQTRGELNLLMERAREILARRDAKTSKLENEVEQRAGAGEAGEPQNLAPEE